MADQNDRLRKVRALLAKAEETTFPDEAEAYLTKASTLIAKWELDEAMVWAQTPDAERSTPIATVIEIAAPYALHKSVLLGAVAQANGCKTIRTETSPKRHKLAVIGFEHDVAITELLFSSLLVQMTRSMLADESRQHSAAATAQWRRSFIMAFSNRVGKRLQETRRSTGEEHDRNAHDSQPSAALVRIDRAARVDEEVSQKFPRLRDTYVSNGSSISGLLAGEQAGNQAELNKPLSPNPLQLSQ